MNMFDNMRRVIERAKKIADAGGVVNNATQLDGLGLDAKERKEVKRMDYMMFKGLTANEKLVVLTINALPNDGWTTEAVSKILNVEERTFKKCLSKLTKDGKVTRSGLRGSYKFTLNDLEDGSNFYYYYNLMDLYMNESANARLVFIYLRSFSKRNIRGKYSAFIGGKEYFACANSIISKDLDISEMTVHTALKRLHEEGLITKFEASKHFGTRRFFNVPTVTSEET